MERRPIDRSSGENSPEFHTNVGHAGNEVAVANSISLRDRRFNSSARFLELQSSSSLARGGSLEPSVSRMLTETFARFSPHTTTRFSVNVDRCVELQKRGATRGTVAIGEAVRLIEESVVRSMNPLPVTISTRHRHRGIKFAT